MIKIKVPSFEEFVNESKNFIVIEEKENNTESMRNYKSYLKGEEPLRHAFLTHKEGDSMYDFVKGSMQHNFSVFPDGHWDKVREKYRKQLFDVYAERNKKK